MVLDPRKAADHPFSCKGGHGVPCVYQSPSKEFPSHSGAYASEAYLPKGSRAIGYM